jgi:RNA polymerase sigma-70 factor (ECF subfamily)
VAHNTATKHIVKEQRTTARRWIDLDDEMQSDDPGPEEAADRSQGLARLMRLIHQLKPPDRQIILLFLEGLEGAAIAEIMGMNAPAVGTRIHRIKQYLTQQFNSVSPGGQP